MSTRASGLGRARDVEANELAKRDTPCVGNADCSRGGASTDPSLREAVLQPRGAQSPADVWLTFCPVKTPTKKDTALAAKGKRVDPAIGKPLLAAVGQLERCAGAAEHASLDPRSRHEHSDVPSQMVVARSRQLDGIGGTLAMSALRLRVRCGAERFEHVADFRSAKFE
jgi:hypothetical protein